MQRRYQRFPRLMFHWRRIQRVNYEPEMELLDVLCDPQQISVDVGAKLGMYTYRLLRHSKSVVAFEPIPLLASMLGQVFARRPCRIVNCALSDHAGRTTMRIPYGSNGEVKFGRSTIESTNPLSHDDVARVEEIDVEMKLLDQCDLVGVGFIKIDVEGHELSVLRGARATLERDRPTLLVEANDHHHPGAVAQLLDLLVPQGYRSFFRRDGALVDAKTVSDPGWFLRESIENFLFVHETRSATIQKLQQRHRIER